MLVLNCPDGAVARDVVEVLASARLRFKPVRGGAGSVGDSGPVHLNVLRDGVRVYVGDPPAPKSCTASFRPWSFNCCPGTWWQI